MGGSFLPNCQYRPHTFRSRSTIQICPNMQHTPRDWKKTHNRTVDSFGALERVLSARRMGGDWLSCICDFEDDITDSFCVIAIFYRVARYPAARLLMKSYIPYVWRRDQCIYVTSSTSVYELQTDDLHSRLWSPSILPSQMSFYQYGPVVNQMVDAI